MDLTLKYFWLIIVVYVLITFSLFISFKKKYSYAIVLLFVAAALSGTYAALLDPFLNVWDEQFHALVAKNMRGNFFLPMLYTQPLLEYDIGNWTGNHIWLHKQPVFLWQIALSIRLFGVNEFAVRFPGILMHALMILLIYRIGKTGMNERIGFWGALFYALAYYPLELVSGFYPTDQNDTAFIFYITASFWAWFEYMESRRFYWIFIVGAFAGLAVLVKWLPGMLVFACWGLTVLFTKELRTRIHTYVVLFLSALTAVAVVAPWISYILIRFPAESRMELSSYSQHFFKVVENQTGDHWFYFDAIKQNYGSGDAVPYILILSLIISYFAIRKPYFRVCIYSSLIIVYTFYTLAETKMLSFCMIVSPFVFLALGGLFDTIFGKVGRFLRNHYLMNGLIIVTVLIVSWLLLNFNQIRINHSNIKPMENFGREVKVHQKQIFQTLKDEVEKNHYVVFNTAIAPYGHASFMFYTDCIGYAFCPNQDQIKLLKSNGYKIAIFYQPNLPEYIFRDPEIRKISFNG